MVSLKEIGVPRDRIYFDDRISMHPDKSPDIDTSDTGFDHLLAKLRPADAVYIQSFEELGYDYADIHSRWNRILYEKNANIVLLDMPSIDTRKQRDIVDSIATDVMKYLSDKKQEHSRSLKEGIERARKRGVQIGRPKADTPKLFESARRKYLDGELSVTEGAKMCGMARSSFYRKVKMYEEG